MPDPDLFVGVDVGTQSLRAVAVTGDGTVVGRGAGPLSSYRRDRIHEQDPEQWWRVLGEALSQALSGSGARAVRGLAICGTSGTFLLCDADLRPATPALMYDDLRAVDLLDEVVATDPRPGHRVQPSWALPRLLWLLRHGPPGLRRRAEAGELGLAHCPDFLAGRLVGRRVETDWSHALKTGYDLDRLTWPDTVRDRLGITPSLLPAVVRPGSCLGQVNVDAAARTGLPAGTPVYAGMTDGCAAQIAAGAVGPGSWNSVLGTTLVIKGVTTARLSDPYGVVYSHRHPDQGWLPGGASSIGAGALGRFKGTLADRDRAARRYEPASGLVYPLVGRGERFPFLAPHAEEFTLGHFLDENDRYAAHLQAVAFVERLAYGRLARLGADLSGPLATTGGGSASGYWCQLRADVLGRPLTVPSEPETAFGMAVLAAAAGGPLAEQTRAMVRVDRVVEPRTDAHRFEAAYRKFVSALRGRGYLAPGVADDA